MLMYGCHCNGFSVGFLRNIIFGSFCIFCAWWLYDRYVAHVRPNQANCIRRNTKFSFAFDKDRDNRGRRYSDIWCSWRFRNTPYLEFCRSVLGTTHLGHSGAGLLSTLIWMAGIPFTCKWCLPINLDTSIHIGVGALSLPK